MTSGFLSLLIKFRRAIDVAKFPLRDRKATLVPALGVWLQFSGDCTARNESFRVRRYPAARATPIDHQPCVPRATTWGEFVAKFLLKRQKRFGRDAHNRARRGMTFQRVPDCTQLEIGKERGLGGGVSAKPLARPRLARSYESHLFLLKYRLKFIFRQH